MLKHINQYFTDRFTPLIRNLHYLVLFFVLFQIVISNFIEVTNEGLVSHDLIEYYATWAHIGIGLLLLLLIGTLIIVELSKHGFSYFYPYLSGDIAQLKLDISQLKLFKIPDPAPKGIASIIQGLGLVASLLVVLSGTAWFILWLLDSLFANDAKEIHELLTGLIEAYVIAHGSMGLLHLFITYRKTDKK